MVRAGVSHIEIEERLVRAWVRVVDFHREFESAAAAAGPQRPLRLDRSGSRDKRGCSGWAAEAIETLSTAIISVDTIGCSGWAAEAIETSTSASDNPRRISCSGWAAEAIETAPGRRTGQSAAAAAGPQRPLRLAMPIKIGALKGCSGRAAEAIETGYRSDYESVPAAAAAGPQRPLRLRSDFGLPVSMMVAAAGSQRPLRLFETVSRPAFELQRLGRRGH